LSSAVLSKHLMIVIHSLGSGGAERVAVQLANWWVQRGWTVSVVTQADSSHDAYPLPKAVQRFVLGTQKNTSNVASALWANLQRVWRLRRLIRRQRPDIVLGMMSTASILCVLAAKGLPCRVFASEHRHPPEQAINPLWQRLRHWAYPRAERVIALTSGTAQWLENTMPSSKTAVIPNAVQWPLALNDPAIDPSKQPQRNRLLAVGRLHPVKGFDVLIDAFAAIAAFFPTWDLVILGEGPERESLEAQIEANNLADRVALPGWVGNVGQWFESADLYVLSSRTEGLSNTLLEAMASGLPVVAFDCETGPREIIRPGIDGVLVTPVGDAEALAAHLSDLMAHEGKRQAYGRRAIDVRDRFSSTRVMALWHQVFSDLR